MTDFYRLEIDVLYCRYPDIVRISVYFLDGNHTLKVYGKPTAQNPEGKILNIVTSPNFSDITGELEKILLPQKLGSHMLRPAIGSGHTYKLSVSDKSSATFMRPQELIVKDSRYSIRDWKRLVLTVAEIAYNNAPDIFERIRKDNPSWFPEDKSTPSMLEVSRSNVRVYAGVAAPYAVDFTHLVLCGYLGHSPSHISIIVKDTEKAWANRGNKPPDLPLAHQY